MNKIMEFKRLKDLREDHDLTTRELANKLEINHVQYWRYEKGQRDLPVSYTHLGSWKAVTFPLLMGN